MSCGLTAITTSVCARHRLGVRERHAHAVALAQLPRPLLVADGGDDLAGLAPAASSAARAAATRRSCRRRGSRCAVVHGSSLSGCGLRQRHEPAGGTRRAGTRSPARPTRRTARAARRSPSPRPSGPRSAEQQLHEPEVARRARARSGRGPRGRRRRPTTGRARARAASRSATASPAERSQPLELDRAAEPDERRAARACRARAAAARRARARPRSAQSAARAVRAGEPRRRARGSRRARSRARAAPGSAGRRPRAAAPARPSPCGAAAARGRAAIASPIIGSRAKRRRNSEWSSSSASTNRSSLDPRLGWGPQLHDAARLLPGAAGPAVCERRHDHAVDHGSRRIATAAGGVAERVRAPRPDRGRDHRGARASEPTGSDARSAAFSSTSSASSSRSARRRNLPHAR